MYMKLFSMVRDKDFIYMYLHNEINDKCKHMQILSVKTKEERMSLCNVLGKDSNSRIQKISKGRSLPKEINHVIADKKQIEICNNDTTWTVLLYCSFIIWGCTLNLLPIMT